MTMYRTRQGDRLDLIAWRHYGRLRGAVERILEANPRLAEQHDPAHLPGGLVIRLPSAPAARAMERIF